MEGFEVGKGIFVFFKKGDSVHGILLEISAIGVTLKMKTRSLTSTEYNSFYPMESIDHIEQ